MDVTDVTRPGGRTADAVRQRSRDIYERLLDRIEERVASPDVFTLSELSQAANVAGRIGLGGEEVRSGDIRIHIVRDTLPPAPQRTLPMPTTHLLYSSDGVPIIEPSDSASDGVSDDAPYPYEAADDE